MTTALSAESQSILERVREMEPLVSSLRDQMETERRMPAALVQAMSERRLFHLLAPKSLGGLEADPMTFMLVIEEVSRMDGSAGWNLMIGSGVSLFAGFMEEHAAREVFGAPDSIMAGAVAPTGRARPEDGGYRVDGKWSFGSGIHHASWVGGNSLIFDGDAPRLENGVPEIRIMMVPARDVEIHDVWHVSGLRGTGSQDFTMTNVFVPKERSLQLFTAQPVHDGPLYRMPPTAFTSQIALVPLGIARGAIDALVELATTKVPMRIGSQTPLRERPMAEAAVARAEALLGSARAYFIEAQDEVWETVKAGDEPTLEQRAKLRLATCNAAAASAQAVDLAYQTGGASSIFQQSRLQRCFRDIHTATQHMAVAPDGLEDVGRVLFGLQPNAPLF
jgi:alkylation response protein AidB-like acyl-CoA dehydrogenase